MRIPFSFPCTLFLYATSSTKQHTPLSLYKFFPSVFTAFSLTRKLELHSDPSSIFVQQFNLEPEQKSFPQLSLLLLQVSQFQFPQFSSNFEIFGAPFLPNRIRVLSSLWVYAFQFLRLCNWGAPLLKVLLLVVIAKGKGS